MTIPSWAQQMDQLAAEGIPFLFVLDFDLQQPLIIPLDQVEDAGIHYYIKHPDSIAPKSPEGDLNAASYTTHARAIPFESYQIGFNKVMHAIQAGDTYLLNLCFATKVEGIPSIEEVFEHASAPFKLLMPGKFVLFSPEQFVSIADGMIRTYPMKGTIDASIPDAETVLLADVKEQEEHATVVDLLRNDLSIVSRKVTVEQYRYITKITTPAKSLLQCSSAISGILEDEYVNKPGSIMHALLPAGSVTGAPKKKTVELIKAIEPEPRGYYTGVFGVFDGKNLDSAVMIRMIEERTDGFYYRSGGGITYRSVAEQEYQEVLDKVYVPS